jgi:hypothetical protein
MADFDAQLPVRALAINFTTEVANAAGTTINPAEDYAQGSTSSGENNVLVAGATTTAPPTYVTATTNPLSLDTAGNLRVVTTTGSTVAVSNFPADSDALAQGSSTSGQLGSLIMGATTTAAPTDVTGTTNPLSLDTPGNLRVTVSGVTPPLPPRINLFYRCGCSL